jgi:cytochrome P450
VEATDGSQVEADFKEDGSIDPYPHYARMREQCPVGRVAKTGGLRPFLITRYEDVKAALNAPQLLKDPRHGEAELVAAGLGPVYFGTGGLLSGSVLGSDPPDHTRLRALVAGQFTNHRTTALAPRIQEITDTLINAFAPNGRAEFMDAFAVPLPALVIAELLGVPGADRERFRRWSQESLLPAHDPRRGAAAQALGGYVTEMVELKRADPGADLISALITGQGEDRLSADEVRGNVQLLIIAGHETTANLLGNGLLALLRDPDQLALLRDRPELIPGAVEEFLRYDGPVERATIRFAAEDLRIGATDIPRGSVVYVALASADRDEAEFPEADRLDVRRAPRGHLAFGYGRHFCLGAPLARLEAKIAFETLLRRLPGLELDTAPEDLDHHPSVIMRGLTALPIRFPAQIPDAGD